MAHSISEIAAMLREDTEALRAAGQLPACHWYGSSPAGGPGHCRCSSWDSNGYCLSCGWTSGRIPA